MRWLHPSLSDHATSRCAFSMLESISKLIEPEFGEAQRATLLGKSVERRCGYR
jgi:hypothetical protein